MHGTAFAPRRHNVAVTFINRLRNTYHLAIHVTENLLGILNNRGVKIKEIENLSK
jgi:peptidyl-tRNA hydrolase